MKPITPQQAVEKAISNYDLDKIVSDINDRVSLNIDTGKATAIIVGEYPKPVTDKVAQIFVDAGWCSVEFKTSSENGERPGLTRVTLFSKEQC